MGGAKGGNAAGAADVLPLDVALTVAGLRLRQLDIENGSVHLERSAQRLSVALDGLVLGEGSLSARLTHQRAGDQQTLAWQADARGLDLAVLRATLDPDNQGSLDGRLALATQGSGRAPRDADPLEAANGTLTLDLDGTRGAGLPLLTYVADQVGLSAFTELRFDALSGEFPVRHGVVQVGRAEIGSGPTHLVLSGDFGLREVDARVNPRVGPGLAPQLAPRLAGTLLATASGLLALPVEITLRGPWSELHYGARPVPPARIDRLFGGIVGAAGVLLGHEGAAADGS